MCCLFPPAVLGKVFGDQTHKTVSFLGSIFEVTFHCQCKWSTLSLVSLCCALMEIVQTFLHLCEVRCRVEAFLYNKIKKNFHTSLADNWRPKCWRGSLRQLPLLLVALSATTVLCRRSYPNPRILELQSSKLCHQFYHCLRLQTLKFLFQKLQSLCYIFDAVISHTVMSHQLEGCFI